MNVSVAWPAVAGAEPTAYLLRGDTVERLMTSPSLPTPVEAPDTQVIEALDLPWDVLVWDDPVNLMSYVVYVLKKVFGFSTAVATKLMLEVHNNGKALVASEPKEQAQAYVVALQRFGLHATMQKGV